QSAEKGPMRMRRTPYFIHPIDTLAEPETEEIVIVKPAQIGGTENIFNIIGYYAHQEPCPILLVMADEKTTGHMAKERLQPMFESIPDMAELIGTPWNREEMKLLNGSFVATAWASSVAALAAREYRVVILDEVDKPGYYIASKEAAPISRARERSETFFSRKHALLSTPTHETGNIWQEFLRCLRTYYFHVPCPSCRVYQPLIWSYEYAAGFRNEEYVDHKGKTRHLGQVVWGGGREASHSQVMEAGYECGTCKKVWTMIKKNHAVEKGKMVVRKDGRPRKIGYHLNRLYSLLGQSGNIAKMLDDFLTCLLSGDPKLLQGFVNSSLAEPWKTYTVERSENAILELRDERPRGLVPSGGVVSCMTGAADTQKDGFWYEVRAWGFGMDLESWQVRERYVTTFDALEKVFFQDEYLDIDGKKYVVRMVGIDAMGSAKGGYTTSQVYDWARRNQGRVIPIKGEQRRDMTQAQAWSRIDSYPGTNKPIPGGMQLLRVNTKYYKDVLANKLGIDKADPGAWHMHSECEIDWARQMTVEYVDKEGLWQCPPGKPNHAWDVSVYQLALTDVVRVKNIPKTETSQETNGRKVRSSGI
ncbi:MAG TPA: terminase, partial [Desulfobacterales bacterium]|nr:terminase [Desulfobacterales bacterium]